MFFLKWAEIMSDTQFLSLPSYNNKSLFFVLGNFIYVV